TMKAQKLRRRLLVLMVLLALLWGGYRFYLFPRLNIINGYTAKIACSCTFVSQLPDSLIRQQDLGYFPISLADYEVNRSAQQVVATTFGLRPRKAQYRPGYGCTLLPEGTARASGLPAKSILPRPPQNGSIQKAPSEELQAWMEAGFAEDLPAGKRYTRALLVMQDGDILAEQYAQGAGPHTPLLGWSMSKSVTAILGGMAARREWWALEEDHLLPRWEEDKRARIRLADLLYMNSGLRWTEDYSNISTATLMLYARDSMGVFTARQPAEYDPGTHWEYSSGTTNLLAYLLARRGAGRHRALLDTLRRKLSLPQLYIEPDAAGFWVGSSYAYATAREWGKLGQLMLQEGHWQGDTLLPRSWYQAMRQPAPQSDGDYGGQIWLNRGKQLEGLPEEVFFFDGYHGQRVFILPAQQAVVVRLGTTYDPDQLDFAARLRNLTEILAAPAGH
ncbi:MAG: serine hydrolase, partial [Schleiferiaceae bacterium]|nr:serine hydrolase [Schleiferiaceae bacterium]